MSVHLKNDQSLIFSLRNQKNNRFVQNPSIKYELNKHH